MMWYYRNSSRVNRHIERTSGTGGQSWFLQDGGIDEFVAGGTEEFTEADNTAYCKEFGE